jgi:hypothetical protein
MPGAPSKFQKVPRGYDTSLGTFSFGAEPPCLLYVNLGMQASQLPRLQKSLAGCAKLPTTACASKPMLRIAANVRRRTSNPQLNSINTGHSFQLTYPGQVFRVSSQVVIADWEVRPSNKYIRPKRLKTYEYGVWINMKPNNFRGFLECADKQRLLAHKRSSQ